MQHCEYVEAQLNDFLDGTLSAKQATALNEHLESCESCWREYQALKATRQLLRSVAVPDGEEARERVLARFRYTVGVTPSPPRHPSLRLFASIVGMTVTAATVVLLFVAYPRLVEKPAPGIDIAAARPDSLPSLEELATMNDLHATQSRDILRSHVEFLQDASLIVAPRSAGSERKTP